MFFEFCVLQSDTNFVVLLLLLYYCNCTQLLLLYYCSCTQLLLIILLQLRNLNSVIKNFRSLS